jgi:(1->4)-alpha-D-glucan 1-alpha-D-glucosylmutase
MATSRIYSGEAIVDRGPHHENLHVYAEKSGSRSRYFQLLVSRPIAIEERMRALIDSVFDNADVRKTLEEFLTLVCEPGWSNSLSLKLMQLTAPGVPDVYQGSELWETSLVDPDNRGPVDYHKRREILQQLDTGMLPPVDSTGAAKLLVTSRTSVSRRDKAELFTDYIPLTHTVKPQDMSSHSIVEEPSPSQHGYP